ncbi:hypothetical protein SAY87_028488 [Trapa incisa]|uniref:Uncharacterized protein n=1 Tax=Trapa incisa TaxID=236973 RepID=A0AAN7KVS2_9MYRT|nr:hypothetical protein SAY87_028488 [Trapa incisa]
MTYAPSNSVWRTSYFVTQRLVWNGIGSYYTKKGYESNNGFGSRNGVIFMPDGNTLVVHLWLEGGECDAGSHCRETLRNGIQSWGSENMLNGHIARMSIRMGSKAGVIKVQQNFVHGILG